MNDQDELVALYAWTDDETLKGLVPDLYESQPDDVVEEWKEAEHASYESARATEAMVKAGLEDSVGICIETGAEGIAYEVDCRLRPTEDDALPFAKKWFIKKSHNIVMGQKRSDFVKQLDKEHKAFLAMVKTELYATYTMTELRDMVNMVLAHDVRLSRLAGRDFCDSFAALANDFIGCETAIRREMKQKVAHIKSMAIVVDSKPMKFPVVMKKGGAKACAFDKKDLERYEREGFVCVSKQ